MSQASPPSLINISITDLNKAFSEGFDFTSPQALHIYWKTYAASSHFDEDPVQTRCRNLFWRLLNSPNAAKSITSFQLAELWQRCQTIQPFDLISDALERSHTSAQTFTSESASSGDSRLKPDDKYGASDESRERPSSAEISRGNARASLPGDFAHSSRTRDPVRRTSAPGATNVGAGRPGLRRSQTSKGRIATLATGSRGKARSAAPRRRSSLTKGRSITTQPPPRSALKPPDYSQALASVDDGTTFTFPSGSSWQSIDEKTESAAAAADLTSGARGSLVDPDFRRTFAEAKRSMSSASNLPPVERGRRPGSIVRFDEAPELIGHEGGKAGASSPGRDSAESFHGRERSNSNVISSDGDEADELTLNRVESNLSRLIRSGHRQSGGRESASSSSAAPGAQQPRSHDSSSRQKEEEILEMGRKAGAPVLPKARPGSKAPERFRLPSPGATF